MRNLKNVTKKDGYIIVMFPNGYHATFFNISNNNIKLAKESLSGFGKFTENMPYMNMFSVIDVRKCAEDTGLSIETIVGFPKINPYVEESILNVLFCKRNISYIKENKNGCSNSFLEWNQENQKIKRQTKDSSKWIWELNNNQYCHEFKGILMGGCLNTFDDISKTYLWPSHELWKNSILFLDISDNTAPSLVEKYLKNNIECIKYTNAVLVGRTILCEQNIKYGKMYVEIIRNLIAKHNEKNIPIISNMDFGHTEPVTILPFGINCRVDCDKRKILFLEMPVVR
jgi:hypothetical protein